MQQNISFLSQLQKNQLVTSRLVQEMQYWDDFQVVFNPLNYFFHLNIQSLDELHLASSLLDSASYAAQLNQILDNLAFQDAFGTEQQCDPRGDFRNYQWSMWNVEV